MKKAWASIKDAWRNLRRADVVGWIAGVTPWLAPVIPAFLVFRNMSTKLDYPEPVALIGAVAVEFIGLAAVHTAVTFHHWNDEHKQNQEPFLLAIVAGAFYVAIILTVNAALDIWNTNPDEIKNVRIVAHALLSLLSVDAALIIAMRARHKRLLVERDDEKAERKAKRDETRKQQGATPATPPATPATVTRQDATPATREEFMTLWHANGHDSIAALARQLNLNPRTAQRWVDKEGK